MSVTSTTTKLAAAAGLGSTCAGAEALQLQMEAGSERKRLQQLLIEENLGQHAEALRKFLKQASNPQQTLKELGKQFRALGAAWGPTPTKRERAARTDNNTGSSTPSHAYADGIASGTPRSARPSSLHIDMFSPTDFDMFSPTGEIHNGGDTPVARSSSTPASVARNFSRMSPLRTQSTPRTRSPMRRLAMPAGGTPQVGRGDHCRSNCWGSEDGTPTVRAGTPGCGAGTPLFSSASRPAMSASRAHANLLDGGLSSSVDSVKTFLNQIKAHRKAPTDASVPKPYSAFLSFLQRESESNPRGRAAQAFNKYIKHATVGGSAAVSAMQQKLRDDDERVSLGFGRMDKLNMAEDGLKLLTNSEADTLREALPDLETSFSPFRDLVGPTASDVVPNDLDVVLHGVYPKNYHGAGPDLGLRQLLGSLPTRRRLAAQTTANPTADDRFVVVPLCDSGWTGVAPDVDESDGGRWLVDCNADLVVRLVRVIPDTRERSSAELQKEAEFLETSGLELSIDHSVSQDGSFCADTGADDVVYLPVPESSTIGGSVTVDRYQIEQSYELFDVLPDSMRACRPCEVGTEFLVPDLSLAFRTDHAGDAFAAYKGQTQKQIEDACSAIDAGEKPSDAFLAKVQAGIRKCAIIQLFLDVFEEEYRGYRGFRGKDDAEYDGLSSAFKKRVQLLNGSGMGNTSCSFGSGTPRGGLFRSGSMSGLGLSVSGATSGSASKSGSSTPSRRTPRGTLFASPLQSKLGNRLFESRSEGEMSSCAEDPEQTETQYNDGHSYARSPSPSHRSNFR